MAKTITRNTEKTKSIVEKLAETVKVQDAKLTSAISQISNMNDVIAEIVFNE